MSARPQSTPRGGKDLRPSTRELLDSSFEPLSDTETLVVWPFGKGPERDGGVTSRRVDTSGLDCGDHAGVDQFVAGRVPHVVGGDLVGAADERGVDAAIGKIGVVVGIVVVVERDGTPA